MPNSARLASIAALSISLGSGGCGGKSVVHTEESGPTAPTWHSGSRLRAHLLDGGDGAAIFVAWHDTELDVDCAFDVSEDGLLRCLPVESNISYSEAGCRTPMIVQPQCSPEIHWGRETVSDPQSDACSPRSTNRVFRATTKTTADAVYFGSPGSCGNSPVQEGQILYTAEHVAPEKFLAGKESLGPTVGGLAPRLIEGDDGSSLAVGLTDAKRESDCYLVAPDSDPLSSSLCVPGPPALSASFADAACTIPVASTSTCNSTEVGSYIEQVVCGGVRIHVTALGPIIQDLAQTYSLQPDVCGVEMTTAPAGSLHQLGAEITTEYPTVDTFTVGKGRIAALRAGTKKTAMLSGTGFIESDTGEPCTNVNMGGTLRCVTTTLTFDRFSDAACTKGIIEVVESTDPACRQPRPRLVQVASGTVCESDYFAVGKEWTGAIYAMDPGGAGCVLSPPLTDHPGRTRVWLDASTKAKPDDFPLVQDRIE